MQSNDVYSEIGKLMAIALERKRDRPKILILKYMEDELEKSKIGNYEPNWGEIVRNARRIWEDAQ